MSFRTGVARHPGGHPQRLPTRHRGHPPGGPARWCAGRSSCRRSRPCPRAGWSTLPGRAAPSWSTYPGPTSRRADDRAAARAGLYGVPHLVRRARRAVAHPPGRRPRPALARPRHPLAAVPDRRLRRRRRRACSTRLGIDHGDRGRLLARRGGRAGGVAPPPRPGQRAGARLDRTQPARPPGRADVLPGDDAGDAPALPGRAHQGRAGGRRRCRRCRRSRSPTATDWGRRSSAAPSAWSMPEVLGELGRFNSASVDRLDRRADRRGRHRP